MEPNFADERYEKGNFRDTAKPVESSRRELKDVVDGVSVEDERRLKDAELYTFDLGAGSWRREEL